MSPRASSRGGGFNLVKKDGNAVFKFPKEYTKVHIGGVAMGDVLKSGTFSVHRKRVDGIGRYAVDEVSLDKCNRLAEPEFYCTHVTYSAIPATRQVSSIRMRGDLCVGNARNADAMVEEITGWMEEDFDADDLRVGVPCGTLALKKLKIGDGMDVVVEVKWKGCQAADGPDAFINITFTVGELVEESRIERQELGHAVDEARVDTLEKTGVDYFTVHPMVDAEAVKRKTVCGGRCYTWTF